MMLYKRHADKASYLHTSLYIQAQMTFQIMHKLACTGAYHDNPNLCLVRHHRLDSSSSRHFLQNVEN